VKIFRKPPAAARIAALLFFVLGALPRSATYVHNHAGSEHAHVHAWDGARLDDMRQLIDGAHGAHDHPHPHPLADVAHVAHEHGHKHEHEPRTAARQARSRIRGPVLAAPTTTGTEHVHSQAPFQTVATCPPAPQAFVAPIRIRALVAPGRTVGRACPALRARSPPLSVQARSTPAIT
jgi:hypothetical protein